MSIPPCSGNIPRPEFTKPQPFPPQQPPCGSYPNQPAFDQQRLNQISRLGMQLQNLIGFCDSTLVDLASARRTEGLDAATSNWSFFGSFVTQASYEKNHGVANKIDRLRNLIWTINQDLMQIGNSGFYLSTELNGEGIRQAENDEHHFFANWFSSNSYSSHASMNTLHQLSYATERVQRVRHQAEQVMYYLNNLTHQAGRPFCATQL